MSEVALRAVDLVRTYAGTGNRRPMTAVDHLSLELHRGETLAIIGASGAGKSTVTRLLLGLEPPDAGTISIGGIDIHHGPPGDRRKARRTMQAVFQDPRASLNPYLSVGSIVSEPLLARGRTRRGETTALVAEALTRVGLDAALAARRPDALSGGQRQRVALARALVVEPEILVLDEPVSALDRPLRSHLLDLLAGLTKTLGLSVILVSHDFTTVDRLADRVIVLLAGRCVESGPTADVVTGPLHPYTRALVAVSKGYAPGRIPDVAVDPEPCRSGCPARGWCPLATSRCADTPPLTPVDGDGRLIACWERDRLE